MIEHDCNPSGHDCNPAARQAGYPVGEDDPDPPALEHGASRGLTASIEGEAIKPSQASIQVEVN
jgi:hypothetical protein